MFPPAPTVKAVVPLTRVTSPAKVTFDWLVIVGLATIARVPLNVRSPLLETGDEVVTVTGSLNVVVDWLTVTALLITVVPGASVVSWLSVTAPLNRVWPAVFTETGWSPPSVLPKAMFPAPVEMNDVPWVSVTASL